MSNVFAIAGIGIAGGAALLALYAVVRNWVWLVRRERCPHESPVLLVGPLFSFIAAGTLAQSVPVVAGWEVWLFPIGVAVVDPGALYLILRASRKTDTSDESG